MYTSEHHQADDSHLVEEARCEWRRANRRHYVVDEIAWRRSYVSGVEWASRPASHAGIKTHPAAAVSALSRLNEDIERYRRERLSEVEDARLDAEIERLETLAASLIRARANVSIDRVSNAIDAATSAAKRLLGE